MKYLKTLSFRTKVFVGLLLVSLVGYGVYSYTWPIYVQWQEDHEVLIVKTEVERIETFGSQNRYVYYKTRDSVTPDVLSIGIAGTICSESTSKATSFLSSLFSLFTKERTI